MTSRDRVPFTQSADIFRNERFISVEPLSGYRFYFREDQSHVIYLAIEAADDVLGQALLAALDRSRFIWPADEPDFFNAERYAACYRNWRKDFMRRYGYTSRRDAFKNMSWCAVRRTEGAISIRPHKHVKSEHWKHFPPDRTVVIPDTRELATAGAAVRLALGRCE